MGSKNVYLFSEGNAQMKELLGGKGANLAEMTRIGLPVPPGFTVSTAACLEYFRREQKYGRAQDEVLAALCKLEEITGKKFGDKTNPLLVSVRSGAVISMPGMMDTVLNLGLNDETVLGLAAAASNERFAYDCYRRFIQMFGDVVLDIDHYLFEHTLEKKKQALGVRDDTGLDAGALQELVAEFKDIVSGKQKTLPGTEEQTNAGHSGSFASWNNQRAIVYRQINKIPMTRNAVNDADHGLATWEKTAAPAWPLPQSGRRYK